MIIGVPKEIKTQEHRVGMLPSAVYQLRKHGHQVIVERDAAPIRAISMTTTRARARRW
jgi:alanine dehydrogenase